MADEPGDPGADPTDHGGPRGKVALLRDHNIGPVVIGNLLSLTGFWVHSIAASVYIYDLTGRSSLVAAVTVAQFFGYIVVSPVAGMLADRFDRRRLLVTTNLIAAGIGLVLTAWAALGELSLLGLVLLTAVGGMAVAAYTPVLQALVPSLVPPRDLAQTIALQSVAVTIARAVGPALAGLLLVMGPLALSLGYNALTHALLAGALLRVRPRVHVGGRLPRRRGSVRLLMRARPIVAVTLLGILLLAIGSDPMATLLPEIATRFPTAPGAVGTLATAFGLGSIAATLIVAPLRAWLGPARVGGVGLVVPESGSALPPSRPRS